MNAYLKAESHRIKYLCLHGFLAVDGVEYVVRRMKDLAPETHSFILDMNQVTGISESAARILNQARVGFRHDDIAVVFSRIHNRKGIQDRLSKTSPAQDRGFLSFEDNDLAAEWCENRLWGEGQQMLHGVTQLAGFPLFAGVPDPLLGQLDEVMYRQSFAKGERILMCGQEDDGRIFFIEQGQASILVPLQNGGHQRISSLGPGMNFGEMVLLGQTTRSASVYADTDVTCRILESAAFNRLAEQTPALKIIMLENLAKDVTNKLRRATQWISALA